MAKDWEAVAKAINARMEELGVTQIELATKSGVATATLRQIQRNYEVKRRNPRTLEAVSRALGWPANHLARVLDGGDDAVADHAETVAEVSALRAEVADLRARVDSIETNQRGDRASG